MAAFVDTLYEADSGKKHPIRLTPEYNSVAGTPPASPATSNIRAKVSKTNREFGIRPRRVILSRTVGTAPNTFRKYAYLPVLTPTAYNSNTFALGATVTINSVDYDVVGKQNEDY